MASELTYDELVTLLSNGISHRQLYFGNHPRVAGSSTEFVSMLGELLKHEGKESFFLGLVDGNLVHNGRFLIGPTIVGRRLVTLAENLVCGGFLFKDSVTTQEIIELFNLAVEVSDPIASLQEARGLMNARGISSIEISPVYEDSGWFGQFLYDGTDDWGNEFAGMEGGEEMIPTYQALYNKMESIYSHAGSDHALDINGARTVTQRMLKSSQGNFMDIMQLVRYPDYDSYTVGHSVRVAMIISLVGQHLGMEQSFLLELGTAGLLHDVGKANIPVEILNKKEQLNDQEREIIEGHPQQGALILLENKEASPLAIGAAWGHHRRHDGGGYPHKMPWGNTSRITGLLHVCDVFEALTALRPYKAAMTPRRAYEIMLADKSSFDPGALMAFVSAMGIYPPGSRVHLSTGESGLVMSAGTDIDQPRIKVTHDRKGNKKAMGTEEILDLGEPEKADIQVIKLLAEPGRQSTPATTP